MHTPAGNRRTALCLLIVTLLFIADVTLGSRARLAAQSATPDTSVHSEWIGELQRDGKWQLLQVHLDENANGLSGTLELPLDGVGRTRLESATWTSTTATLTSRLNGEEVTFTGQRIDGEWRGHVAGVTSGSIGEFALRRLAHVSFDDYTGGYETPDGRLITINAWPDQEPALTTMIAQYSDSRTRRFGALYPISTSRFISGGPIARVFPIESDVTFERDRHGSVTGLVWKEPGTPAVAAKKLSPYREERVTFANADVTLSGTLLIPNGKGPFPAIVLTHGSGPQIRQHGLLEQLLVRQRFAVLTYDKRGVGASTGDWTGASFADLADDAVAGARLLERRSDIDRARIGFWGLSQGAWIGPLAASRLGTAAFVIAASAGTPSPEREELIDTETALRGAGFSDSQIADALAFQAAKNTFMRSGDKWDAYAALRATARQQKWYAFGNTDAWGPASRTDPYWAKIRTIYFYDPLATLATLRCPVLYVWGDLDTPQSVQASLADVAALRQQDPRRRIDTMIFPNAGHNLMVGEANWATSLLEQRLTFAPGYPERIVTWAAEQVR